ncbi:hypothetical protein T484DRAFT_1874242 [Baffinella frigidus]|nr:hypothetical protein T484DRAFT_1874242 [Cryptophyta sp. CCMP2293]
MDLLKAEGGGERFAFLLMDFRMPVMDGIQATRALRDMGLRTLPVIALSAEADNIDDEVDNIDDETRALFTDILNKPCNKKKKKKKQQQQKKKMMMINKKQRGHTM